MFVRRVPKRPVELTDPEAVSEDPFDPVDKGADIDAMLADFAVASPNGNSNEDESSDGHILTPGTPSTRSNGNSEDGPHTHKHAPH